MALPIALLLAALGSAGAVTSTAAAARVSTVATNVSSNWSGYVVQGLDATGASRSFSSVSGTWVQPSANCSAAGTAGSTSSAFWVGLGGNSTSSAALEQTGTRADCDAYGNASYDVWYELVPRPSVEVGLHVSPGDTISASVTVHGGEVTVQVKNLSRRTGFSKTLTIAAPDTTSAEWIAEAPSICASSYECRQMALTNFGTVEFSNASVTSGGRTGTISDAAWTSTSVQLSGRLGDRFGYGRFGGQLTAAQAVPTALRKGGAAFSVRWRSGASSSGAQGAQGPGGFGQPPGYGGGASPDPYSL